VAATAIPFILLGIWEAKNGRVIAEEKTIIQRLEEADKSEKDKAAQPTKPQAQNQNCNPRPVKISTNPPSAAIPTGVARLFLREVFARWATQRRNLSSKPRHSNLVLPLLSLSRTLN